jgi:DNA-binding transcriptional regulator YiaG
MPNLTSAINDQIRRLCRREVRAGNRPIKRATAHYRRDIAALKRQIAQLLKQVAGLKKLAPEQTLEAPPEAVEKARLRITGLKTHRKKLGLSAKDYGKLLGVSSLTIYNWEAGKSKPRRSQLPRIVAVRGIGKREALKRLGMDEQPTSSNGENTSATPKHRRRGVYSQTAEEFVLGLLKGRKKLTTGEINAAWKKSGHKHNADNTLSKMTREKKVKRTKVKDGRGSEYRVG